MKLKYIWVTSESDLNKMFEINLDKIWVKFKLNQNNEDWT